ncbi:MAG: hypothetical protein V5B35_11120 [Candidatus Accumulibacter necessarius]|jgi:hypothetical protein|uniref:hypothetical protein n=1 Tax=Candidatus Accumulibacter necessarius TaxID=2954386 RepID=UPI002FC2E247
MKKNADRFVHAVFCDDIRQELGEKVSLMGCYQGELLVAEIPVLLPKLCAFVTVSTPLDRPIKSLKIRIMQDDHELVSLELPDDAMAKASQSFQEGSTRLNANSALAFSPFAVTAPTVLRVTAITEEGEIIGPRLRIKTMPESAALQAVSAPDSDVKPTAPRLAGKKPAARRVKEKPD